MRSIDWSRIKDLNFKQAWRILSSEISNKFFHDEMVVVPNIGDAAYYDLMVCFSKNKSGYKLAGAPGVQASGARFRPCQNFHWL